MCNDIGPIPDCQSQSSNGGNTYEITIKDGDRLIVSVESRFVASPVKTIISPRGIEQAMTSMGLVYHKVDWSIRPEKPEYE
jgi:hypothetical protein